MFTVWTFLEEKNKKLISAQQVLYVQRLESTVFDEKKEDMQSYLNRISRLVSQVRSCNGTVQDVSYSGYLLHGLPSSYEMVNVLLNSQRGDPESIKNSF